MTGHNLPVVQGYVGGCVIPEPPRQLPLDQRVDLVALADWNRRNKAARESYYAAPIWFGRWPS